MHDKKELRAHLKALRASLGVEQRRAADERIARQVCTHPAYVQAKTVYTYLSMGTEVDTRALIRDAWQRGKTVAIPRVKPGTRLMEWYAISSFDGLEKSFLGVEEPPANLAQLVTPPLRELQGGRLRAPHDAKAAVAIVPGLSFDEEGYRLGYGGGFYDVFLSTFAGVSLGLCRKAQFSDVSLPRDELDVPVDLVVLG